LLLCQHTLLPLRKAVIMQSEQKRCKHSLVVIVFFSISKQIGHISSLCKLRGLTAISVLSVIASCGVRCNSYNDNSHVLLRPTCSVDAIFITYDCPKIYTCKQNCFDYKKTLNKTFLSYAH